MDLPGFHFPPFRIEIASSGINSPVATPLARACEIVSLPHVFSLFWSWIYQISSIGRVMNFSRLFNFFLSELGLFRRRLTTAGTEGTTSCCFPCVPGSFPKPIPETNKKSLRSINIHWFSLKKRESRRSSCYQMEQSRSTPAQALTITEADR